MTRTDGSPGATRLGTRAIAHLPTDLDIDILDVDASYWSHLSTRPELADGRILSVFDYDGAWTWWERHPVGDELVLVLRGEIELELDDGRASTTTHLSSEESAVIPCGAWHRIAESRTSRVLFVTPTPARTEHRPV